MLKIFTKGLHVHTYVPVSAIKQIFFTTEINLMGLQNNQAEEHYKPFSQFRKNKLYLCCRSYVCKITKTKL